MRKSGWCWLGWVALALLLVSLYAYLGGKNASKVDRILGITALRTIHANWVEQERPLSFAPKDYVTSLRIQVLRHTNTYALGAKSVKALALAHWPSSRDERLLAISEDGVLFWIDGVGNAEAANE